MSYFASPNIEKTEPELTPNLFLHVTTTPTSVSWPSSQTQQEEWSSTVSAADTPFPWLPEEPRGLGLHAPPMNTPHSFHTVLSTPQNDLQAPFTPYSSPAQAAATLDTDVAEAESIERSNIEWKGRRTVNVVEGSFIALGKVTFTVDPIRENPTNCIL